MTGPGGIKIDVGYIEPGSVIVGTVVNDLLQVGAARPDSES